MSHDTEPDFEPSAGDVALALLKGVAQAVPVAGGGLAEMLAIALESPLQRRRDEFLKGVADGLRRLEERVDGLSLEGLVTREEFVSVVVEAAQVSMRTHQKAKLDALRNAVLNVAARPVRDDRMIDLHLATIDGLSVMHLEMLLMYREHAMRVKTECQLHGEVADLSNSFHEALKDSMDHDDELFMFIHGDLKDRRLIYRADSGLCDVHGNTLYYESPTRMGFEFLDLISAPNELSDSA